MSLVVVPTGTANMASVAAAFHRLGVELSLTRTPGDVRSADQLVLPGVGAFGAAMGRIDERDWRRALVDRIEAGRPTLAICLGMQLLAEKSEESPGVPGLGVVPGSATRFSAEVMAPQLGWNEVVPEPSARFLNPGWAYFANSYRLTAAPDGWTTARTPYGGAFISAMERGDVLACQFHPELSGPWGAQLLGRWLIGTRGGS